MKVLHTADWHIGQFKGPVEDGVNLRSLDTVKCLEYMVEKAKEEKPDLVCISGDVFHQEQIGPVRYSDEMVTAKPTWKIPDVRISKMQTADFLKRRKRMPLKSKIQKSAFRRSRRQ